MRRDEPRSGHRHGRTDPPRGRRGDHAGQQRGHHAVQGAPQHIGEGDQSGV